jgi:hypothetical protein
MLMQLQGPSLGNSRGVSVHVRPQVIRPQPQLTGLAGFTDAVSEHPWLALGAFLVGAWVAHKYAPAWGSEWGSARAGASRGKLVSERARLSGTRRRKH